MRRMVVLAHINFDTAWRFNMWSFDDRCACTWHFFMDTCSQDNCDDVHVRGKAVHNQIAVMSACNVLKYKRYNPKRELTWRAVVVTVNSRGWELVIRTDRSGSQMLNSLSAATFLSFCAWNKILCISVPPKQNSSVRIYFYFLLISPILQWTNEPHVMWCFLFKYLS